VPGGLNVTEPSASAAPQEEYTRRLAARRAEEARLTRRYYAVARARNALFGAVVLQILLTEKETAAVFVSLLALPAVSLVGLVLWRARVGQAVWRAARAAEFYEQRLARVEERWAGLGEPGTRYLDDEHPCAVDLDLFGSGSLFERLSTPCTRWGQDALADWLRGPAGPDEVAARQAAVAELRPWLDLREEMAALTADGPAGEDVAALTALAAWAAADVVPVSPALRRTALVLTAACLASLLAWLGFGAGPLPFLAALAVERTLALYLRERIRRALGAAEGGPRGLAALAALVARAEREPVQAPRLVQVRAALAASAGPASRRLRRLRRLLALAPLAYPLFCRASLALALDTWRQSCGGALARWLTSVGDFEALCALAAYAYETPDDPFPEVVPDGPCFDADDLGHPLLPAGRCVRNGLRLAGDLRLLIVSGSNMAGKSTFLRTVGVNAVLALAGAPVRARRLRLSPLTVGATLRVQDSLAAGRSRFYAEVLRVRRLLDMAGRGPLLFLLDELFQGTNSGDRRAGAEAVLRLLIDRGAVGLATTHDLALTQIADRLGPRAANAHFEDHFEAGALTFDYRLRPGVVKSTNGLALMRAVGIEV
jgi:hypothetical protein